MDLQLGDKTALVTGSSKGIGQAIVEILAEEGATVIVHGRDRSAVDGVVQGVVDRGGRAFGVLGDLTNSQEVERLADEALHYAGTIDILVNNAGGSGARTDWGSIAVDDWSSTYDTNVLAALRMTARFLPIMRRERWGRIINISSGAATLPPANGGDYSAAKASINAMTASMAKAVAQDGVTVNAVSPGTIRSSKLEKGFRAAAAAHGIASHDAPWEAIEHGVLPLFASVPMGRVGTLRELAAAVAFLASPLASYITGTNLHVDGGFSSIA